MSLTDILIGLCASIVLILVGYRIYLFPQSYLFDRAKTPITRLDHRIPFQPRWVWIYSGLFYPYWLSPILIISNLNELVGLSVSYFALLFVQLIIAHLIPVRTPVGWRQFYGNNSLSQQLLNFVQSIDRGGNTFPSMHVAVAVLTSLHIVHLVDTDVHPEIWMVWIIPIMIAISTLYTKQHLIIDLPAGLLLAISTYEILALFGLFA